MDGGQDGHHDDVKDEVEDEEEDEEGLRRVCRKNHEWAPKKKRQKKKFSTESQGFGHLYFSVFTFPKNNVSVLLKQNV